MRKILGSQKFGPELIHFTHEANINIWVSEKCVWPRDSHKSHHLALIQTSTNVVLSKISQSILNGSAWKSVQTFIVSRWHLPLTLRIPWHFIQHHHKVHICGFRVKYLCICWMVCNNPQLPVEHACRHLYVNTCLQRLLTGKITADLSEHKTKTRREKKNGISLFSTSKSLFHIRHSLTYVFHLEIWQKQSSKQWKIKAANRETGLLLLQTTREASHLSATLRLMYCCG